MRVFARCAGLVDELILNQQSLQGRDSATQLTRSFHFQADESQQRDSDFTDHDNASVFPITARECRLPAALLLL